MLIINAEEVQALAPMPRLIECLREKFRVECCVPLRQVQAMPGGDGSRLLLSMPAFDLEGGAAIKILTSFPDNDVRGLPTLQGAIILFSNTGTPLALVDGSAVTRLRTGAASALASTYLSRPDSSTLVIVGTGALAPMMALGHCAVRPITKVAIWGRRHERAANTAAAVRALLGEGIEVGVSDSLESTVRTADILSCATSSPTPLISGRWLKPGTFVDLAGSFSPTQRETDDEVVLRSRVFVDTLSGGLVEGGDVADPIARGIIDRRRVEGELADLVRGAVRGRATEDEITLFKSVGSAIEDLAAAQLIVQNKRSIGDGSRHHGYEEGGLS
jgi:alanine dehydrogenase